jgi:hypothetical protein
MNPLNLLAKCTGKTYRQLAAEANLPYKTVESLLAPSRQVRSLTRPLLDLCEVMQIRARLQFEKVESTDGNN